jgi:hypothetical protein
MTTPTVKVDRLTRMVVRAIVRYEPLECRGCGDPIVSDDGDVLANADGYCTSPCQERAEARGRS